MGSVLALCVGINRYSNYPSSNLSGCVNDAKDMAALLDKSFGLSLVQCQLMLDEQATKAAVFGALKAYVDRAINDPSITRIVFSQSSHGTQCADVNGDETDGLDEAFCMSDLNEANGDWDHNTVIIDDELHDLFNKVPATCIVDVFFDTCHSGTGLKELDPMQMLLHQPIRPRCLPHPSVTRRVHERKIKRSKKGLDADQPFSAKLAASKSRAILWAACGANQTSADAWFRENGVSVPGGAFTQTMLKIWKPGTPRATMMKLIRAAVKKGGFTQVPRLETDDKKLKALAFDQN